MNTNSYLGLIAALALLIPLTVFGGIYKEAAPKGSSIPVYWWPILPQLPGWVHDEASSRRYESNFLVPRGQTFTTAPAVIYARALYKPNIPEAKSLEQLIAADQRQFKQDSPGIRISEQAALQDADGRGFRCFSFTPLSEGSWEQVAYGDEDDYFLIFTVSGKTPGAVQSAMADFKSLISRYKRKL